MCFHIPHLSPNQQHVLGEPVSADSATAASIMLHKGKTTVLGDLTTATTVFQPEASQPEASRMVFTEGLYVVQWSNKFWAGLSTDTVIEQVLMRSLKISGGLTQGRGMSEIQIILWLLSRPSCSAVNVAMQEFMEFVTSDQHEDISKARQECDVMDTEKLIAFLSSHQPFSTASTLRGIDTGVCAADGVNANIAVCRQQNPSNHGRSECPAICVQENRPSHHNGQNISSTSGQELSRHRHPTAVSMPCHSWQ